MDIQLTEKTDIKVFILYLLKNIKEPLEFSTINDIVLQDGFVNYFDFSICFGELVEGGQIEELDGEKGSLYKISALGEEAVSNVEMRLFNTVRVKALRSALRLLAFYKSGSRIKSSVTETEGGYILNCIIEDSKRKLLPHRKILRRNAAQQLRRARRKYIQRSIGFAFRRRQLHIR